MFGLSNTSWLCVCRNLCSRRFEQYRWMDSGKICASDIWNSKLFCHIPKHSQRDTPFENVSFYCQCSFLEWRCSWPVTMELWNVALTHQLLCDSLQIQHVPIRDLFQTASLVLGARCAHTLMYMVYFSLSILINNRIELRISHLLWQM